MITKYKAKLVYYSPSKNRQLTKNEIQAYKSYGINSGFADAIKFDSYHEYKVYLSLRNSYIISEVIPHPKIEILSKKDKLACFPTGKRWAVDFIARGHHKETLMLVEAKGVITQEFPFILAMLEKYHRELFGKLWLVFPNRIPKCYLIQNLLRRQNQPNMPRIVTLKQFQGLIG